MVQMNPATIAVSLPQAGNSRLLHWKQCGGRVEGLVTAGDMLAALKNQLLENNPQINFSNAVLAAAILSLLLGF